MNAQGSNIGRAVRSAIAYMCGGSRQNGFVANHGNVSPIRPTVDQAREIVEAHEFGGDTGAEFVGRLTNGGSHEVDARACIEDVRAILSGSKGQAALDAFVSELMTHMTHEPEPQGWRSRPARSDTQTPEQNADLRSILQTEKDGRLYAITMLEALEESVEELEAESEGEPGENGQITVYREGPQSDILMRWMGDVYKYATPDAFNGFYCVLTDYIGSVMAGGVPTPAGDFYSDSERKGRLDAWGTVNYRDPDKARAAIADKTFSYKSEQPRPLEQPVERNRKQSGAEKKAADRISRAFGELYAIHDIAQSLGSLSIEYWTVNRSARMLAKSIKKDLAKAASVLSTKHKARAHLSQVAAMLDGVLAHIEGEDDGSGNFSSGKEKAGAVLLALIRQVGCEMERAELACGQTVPTAGYLQNPDFNPVK